MNFRKIAKLATMAYGLEDVPDMSDAVTALRVAIEDEIGLPQTKEMMMSVLYGECKIVIKGVHYIARMDLTEDDDSMSAVIA